MVILITPEKTSALALVTLDASDYSADDYSIEASITTCNASVTYSLASIPAISAVSSDGGWKVCVKLSDSVGNTTYGASDIVTRDTSAPSVTSFNLANEAVNGYINDSEKALNNALVSLSGENYDSDDFAIVASATTCNESVTYNFASIPLISEVGSEGSYKVCVKLSDLAGNTPAYSGSDSFEKDITAPFSFTEMLAANEAAGGINDSEKLAANLIYSITASGYTVDDFTAAVASTTTCDVAQTYSNGTIPLISSISSDGDYVVCAKLTDAAGNISYGKSATVTRDVSELLLL